MDTEIIKFPSSKQINRIFKEITHYPRNLEFLDKMIVFEDENKLNNKEIKSYLLSILNYYNIKDYHIEKIKYIKEKQKSIKGCSKKYYQFEILF